MNQIIKDFNARLAYLGWTKQELAERVHKEASTVSKQLDPKTSNPQLSTLVLFAEALGGELQFVTKESARAAEEADVSSYRNRLSEMGTEISYLRQRVSYLEKLVEEKNEKIKRRDWTIAERESTIEKKEQIIEEKDKTIARKDAKISELFDRILK